MLQIRHSDACERNKEPILEVLRDFLPDEPRVLEIGSGTGQHAVYFAEKLEGVEWQPADRPGQLESVRGRYERAELENLREPVALDLFDDEWAVDPVDAVVAVNVLHIAPWEATERLFAHADETMAGDLVYVYGPFRYEGRELEDSNQRFDQMLRARDPEMGLRVVADVEEKAAEHGFELVDDRPMPANNRSLIWRRV
jgi:cyclopropane fatty-acyl-phospholipid synthase-like methyltransferase